MMPRNAMRPVASSASAPLSRFRVSVLSLLFAAGLAGCGQQAPAPVSFSHRTEPSIGQQRSSYGSAAIAQIPSAENSADGEIVVQRGDTLYGLARRHNLQPRTLIEANNLHAPYILQPGQYLRAPGVSGNTDVVVAAAPVERAPVERTAVAPAARQSTTSFPLSPASVAPALTGTGVAVEELPPPGQISAQAAPLPAVMPAPTVAAKPAPKAPASIPVSSQETITAAPSSQPVLAAPVQPAAQAEAEPEPQVAAAPHVTSPSIPQTPMAVPMPAATPVAPPRAAAGQATDEPPPRSGRTFAWPVRGRILSTFGPKPDGLHNDGINIAARAGAPVIAAENGVVVYSGNEMRGFGNLLLVRHADGWMTAYAHLDRVLVQKGQKVTRGQAIATVGNSGGADQPQLHFEIRKGTQAVDPAKFLTVAMLYRPENLA